MRNSKNQVMCFGACAVLMGTNGHVATSIDVLANGVRNLFTRISRH